MSDEIEEWRPVVGFEGWYEVSDWGRIKRIVDSHAYCAGYILADGSDSNVKYNKVTLCDGCRKKGYYVHRIVASAFIGPNCGGHTMEVNHKDGNKLNNRLSNLEYTTSGGNKIHAYKFGLMNPLRGENSPRHKMTDGEVAELLGLKGAMSGYKAAAIYGISQMQVSRIWRGKRRAGAAL